MSFTFDIHISIYGDTTTIVVSTPSSFSALANKSPKAWLYPTWKLHGRIIKQPSIARYEIMKQQFVQSRPRFSLFGKSERCTRSSVESNRIAELSRNVCFETCIKSLAVEFYKFLKVLEVIRFWIFLIWLVDKLFTW